MAPFLILLFSFSLMPGYPLDAKEQDLGRCMAIEKTQDRLICFEEIARHQKNQPVTEKQKEQKEQKQQEILARIESVRKTPLGHRIMTLSNGQVWSENEVGRMRIDAQQEISIIKKRWRYIMRLNSGRVITVRRLDD